ncbi:MAG: cation diffusion facilitator family transporter, partial [Polyangiales bacterium]
AAAVGLGSVKLVAWWWSGSVAVLASAVDSGLDASASLLNALVVRYAMTPPDDKHRFGHGKSEALAGLAQALLITLSSGFILQHAIERFQRPLPLQAVESSVAVMVVSLGVTLALVLYQRHVITLTNATTVKADALHYASDIAANLGTLLSLAAAPFGWRLLDPLSGVAIALVTLHGALRIAWESYDMLMDRELPHADQQRIRRSVVKHPMTRGIHELRTRRSGPATQIQFHLELDGHMTLAEANAIAHEIALRLDAEFPGADVLIHQDPSATTATRPQHTLRTQTQ